MPSTWTCPECSRAFTRKNQRHACGTGDVREVLRGRPDEVVATYVALETFARSLGEIELVARDRYVLLRSVRIFTDLVIMKDALRVAVHLERDVTDPLFFEVVRDRKRVTHVAKIRTLEALTALEPYLKEAYACSIA